MHYAHSFETSDKAGWQPLIQHLRQVSALAAARGGKFGAGRAAALAGLLHDLGKYSAEFQRYIGGNGPSPDHSTAGAIEVGRLLSEHAANSDRIVADLLAYAIAGHHAGLADRTSELSDRLKRTGLPQIDSAWRAEIAPEAVSLMPGGFSWDQAQMPFQLAFMGRMIFSCLVDADFVDTEAFYAEAAGGPVDRTWPRLDAVIDRQIAAFYAHMAELQRDAAGRASGGQPNELDALRSSVLAHARSKASMARNVFTLNVPTGGGKTLTSLGFALDHAKAHRMDRIVVAIPFTSIIDQTASIFRSVLGDDLILEHHSAIDEADRHERGADPDRDKMWRAKENWDAPIVVTTNVQLFESLFANRTSRCRKLHNLANAVIVLDEAQTIPLPVLRPCIAALKELVRNYGCSVVLCTATQPALGAPSFADGFDLVPERELAPDPAHLHRVLRRVTLNFGGEMTDDALVAELIAQRQAMVIVNSRKHALALYEAVKKADRDGAIHLTTRQTASDRRVILADVRKRLSDGAPCRLIATSLVEAGVDIDFPRVWRAEVGLDQIMQAAGRCNREGIRQAKDSLVTVFKPAEAKPPPELKAFAEAFDRIRPKHADHALLEPGAIADYFGEVYWQRGREALDKHNVLDSFKISSGITYFQYRSVANNFRLIESGMEPVIVVTDDAAKQALEGLRGGWLTPGAAAQRLQTSVVQVPPKDRAKLVSNGHVAFVEGFGDQFAVLRSTGMYTHEIGLRWEEADQLAGDGIV